MRVPRFHAPDAPVAPGERFVLSGDEAVHLGRVLRLRPGDAVEVFDGAGAAVRCELTRVGRRETELVVLGPGRPDPSLPFALTAAVAPPKGKRVQRLVEGLTELGVAVYAPLLLERGQVRPPGAESIRRWALEAAKQCGRNTPLAPGEPLDLDGLRAAAARHDLALLAAAEDDAPPLREVPARPAPASVLLAVGPEGGVTAEERAGLLEAGFAPARLGGTVLRVETAALALTGALVAAWG